MKKSEEIELKRSASVCLNHGRPINVSSVVQRSPFRYPGGKTWFVPYVRQWLEYKSKKPRLFVEPFTGGGIVGLSVAFEHLASEISLWELDDDISSVWKTILGSNCRWLIGSIKNFVIDRDSVLEVLNSKPISQRQRALQTILKNRVKRGGIMAAGAGMIKKGENGKGITSRWYPDTLAKRIESIHDLRARIKFTQGDGFDALRRFGDMEDTVFFIDPPYTNEAKRLYNHWDINHEELFEVTSRCKGDFLMTYDNTPEIIALGKTFGFQLRPIPMKNTHHTEMTELIIGNDLSWLDS